MVIQGSGIDSCWLATSEQVPFDIDNNFPMTLGPWVWPADIGKLVLTWDENASNTHDVEWQSVLGYIFSFARFVYL